MERAARVLVGGIGNVFLCDDGFGVEVIRELSTVRLPDSVRLVDVGIRGIHLAFDLLEHEYETVLLVDTVSRGGTPGTLYVIQPEAEAGCPGTADAHAMTPASVLQLVERLGGTAPRRCLFVGCEPASVAEGVGLSPAVQAAVRPAADLVCDILARAGCPLEVVGPDAAP